MASSRPIRSRRSFAPRWSSSPRTRRPIRFEVSQPRSLTSRTLCKRICVRLSCIRDTSSHSGALTNECHAWCALALSLVRSYRDAAQARREERGHHRQGRCHEDQGPSIRAKDAASAMQTLRQGLVSHLLLLLLHLPSLLAEREVRQLRHPVDALNSFAGLRTIHIDRSMMRSLSLSFEESI